MVARMSKLKREHHGAGQQQQDSSASPSFGVTLNKTAVKKDSEENCVVTYNAKRQLQTFYYCQSREYTY